MNQTLDEELMSAANYGDVDAIKRLLREGADVHAENDWALQLAAGSGHSEVVALLLKSGADIHANDNYALRYAAEIGCCHVVDLLLKSGADIHAEDDQALAWAAHDGHLGVVDLLLKSGADVHADDDMALRTAVYFGHTEVVDILLKAGAYPTNLFLDLDQEQITDTLKQHAATAFRGMEAVMMLDGKSRMAVLRHLHPELTLKQMREELVLMEAMSLDAGQMGEMWTVRHVAFKTSQEIGVTP